MTAIDTTNIIKCVAIVKIKKDNTIIITANLEWTHGNR